MAHCLLFPVLVLPLSFVTAYNPHAGTALTERKLHADVDWKEVNCTKLVPIFLVAITGLKNFAARGRGAADWVLAE